ncbi:hypothetical protein Fcan01_19434 [Folsomia candida]|uniref:Uncharacterized protein n=1 Tax=Folsomia candida TaxID=158441 RepID=A0A226DKY6_FOLCA|nr:hypothetical protein Fcan01_19434 [Folsomia candida]
MDPLLPCLPDITYLSQQNRLYSIILMLTDEEELLLVSELRRLFKIGLHLTHLHLKQIFYVFATTVKPPRFNKFCHATSTVDIAWFDEFCNRHSEIISHSSVLTHQGAFDTCSRHNQALLTLPSSAQNTGEAHGSPVITPTTAPSSNLPPNFKTRPGILSYSASRHHSTRPIRYRPRHRLLHTSGLAQQFSNPPKTTPPSIYNGYFFSLHRRPPHPCLP